MGRPKKVKPTDADPVVDISHSDDGGQTFTDPISFPVSQPAVTLVTFTGDPRGGVDPAFPEYGGMSFPKGKPVSVDAEWLKANGNVRKNNHFKVE